MGAYHRINFCRIPIILWFGGKANQLHSPYDPPYMLEAVDSAMRPLGRSRLYHLEIPPERSPAPPALAQLSPLEPARLATDLLPLLAAVCPSWADFAPPDAEEAAFLLRWLGR